MDRGHRVMSLTNHIFIKKITLASVRVWENSIKKGMESINTILLHLVLLLPVVKHYVNPLIWRAQTFCQYTCFRNAAVCGNIGLANIRRA